jgi:hypothetical protein
MSNAGGDSTPDSRAGVPTPNHLGIVYLQHAGKAVPLRFSFEAFHYLQQEHGLQSWKNSVADAIDNLDISAMAKIMALVADVTEEEAQQLCVPLLPARDALIKAWVAGTNGNVPDGDIDAEKMAPQMIQTTLLDRLSLLLSGLGSPGATSGNSPRTQPE